MHFLKPHTHNHTPSARSFSADAGGAWGTLTGAVNATCVAGEREVQNPSIQRSRLSLRGGLSVKGRALASVFTMFAALAITTPATAMELIQCPGWQDLVPKSSPINLRTSAPSESFETRIARAIETADASSSGKSQPKSALRPSAKVPQDALPKIAGGCKSYTVRAGDTLGKIAARALGSAARHGELLAANSDKVKSATSLQVGTVLQIPCSAEQLAAKKAAEPKRKPWGRRKPVAAPKATEKPASKIVEAAPKPAPKPLPRWSAKKGEYLSDVIKRWGKKNGYTVIVDGPAEWKLGVKFSEVGTFEEVVQQLIKGFARDGLPPSVRIHSNKVLKIGAGT
jgi:LysM repeat protein